jgi:5-methylcytosine-specific restriction endonuclease McrA
MVKPPRLNIRFAILARDNFRCFYCGVGPDTTALEVDHIIPRSRGGGNRPDNLVTCCYRCNAGKRNELFATDLQDLLMARVYRRPGNEQIQRLCDEQDVAQGVPASA